MAVVVGAYVALGANLGDAQGTVRAAMDQVARLPQTQLVAASSLYRTAPVDSSGPDYINAVVAVDTGLTATELLQAMQQIELQAGRERPYRNAPRTLDLDLLMYGELVQEDAALTLPHPRMFQRAFVLVPLHEIAPERVTAEQLEAVADQGIVRIDEAR
ncbi:2-amino-4-hydroxy-6-hydroxymethyldihydropteridine diphosphokinase [Brachymonas denitrificans]|uniref:2-amino-4-hydroxy-6-hydroxymethyldihydropteridine pyrophosphokinase n=1 Tax=Brachymonas denitrificans DSM 15123 TaxID=1121117 RepID=A0A1H8EIE2_9BURK|nr:2-amino-4-hydroxy-6-hydroxymethyldihydropteridine diphosphokinase [Brachymonas denitrificans]SEN18538.1 2-amino-4-hydroxy-6-hydroxymethyldihydropteridinediphosphokinase [Brachymonas denitrificans DSM 15123]